MYYINYMDFSKIYEDKTIIFNKDKFPIVEVIINSMTNEEEYNMFENLWIELYKKKENFYFIFKMANITNVHMKYITKMVSFIKFLKNNIKKQYLQFSIIVVSNNFIKHLLNIIFKLTTPVAPVYIVNNDDYYIDLLKDIINKKKITDRIKYIAL